MKIQGLILGSLVVAMGLSACHSDLDKVRGEFIANCRNSGGSKAACTCVIDHVQDKYGKEGLVQVQTQGRVPADFSQTLIQGAQQCRGK